MLLVKPVRSFIFASILPDVVSVPMHHPILKFAFEVASVGPLKGALPTHFVILPRARIFGPIRPKVDPFAFFDPLAELAVIVAPV